MYSQNKVPSVSLMFYHNLEVSTYILFINDDYPFIGASPDCLVTVHALAMKFSRKKKQRKRYVVKNRS